MTKMCEYDGVGPVEAKSLARRALKAVELGYKPNRELVCLLVDWLERVEHPNGGGCSKRTDDDRLTKAEQDIAALRTSIDALRTSLRFAAGGS